MGGDGVGDGVGLGDPVAAGVVDGAVRDGAEVGTGDGAGSLRHPAATTAAAHAARATLTLTRMQDNLGWRCPI